MIDPIELLMAVVFSFCLALVMFCIGSDSGFESAERSCLMRGEFVYESTKYKCEMVKEGGK